MRLFALSLIGIGLLSFVIGCKDTQALPGTLSTVHTSNYVGDGFWSWDLRDDGTFTATQKATLSSTSSILSFDGIYAAHDTGFLKFIVGSNIECNACEQTPVEGDTTFGISAPGVVLATSPLGTTLDEFSPALGITACPNGAQSLSALEARIADGASTDLSASFFWGRLEFADAASIIAKRFRKDKTANSDQTLGTTSACVDGTYTVNTGNLVANNHGFALHSDGTSTSFAMPREEPISTLLKDRYFVGLLYLESTNSTQAIYIHFSSATTGTVSTFSDVTVDETTEIGTLTLAEVGSGATAGFQRFEVDLGSSGAGTLWTAIVSNLNASGRSMMYGNGLSADHKDSFALFAIQN